MYNITIAIIKRMSQNNPIFVSHIKALNKEYPSSYIASINTVLTHAYNFKKATGSQSKKKTVLETVQAK